MRIFYTIFIYLYWLAISVASLWNQKAKKWIIGRKKWKQLLKNNIPENQKVVWFHCASLGEFDQGLPVMEQLKKNEPTIFLLVTFFSPSGYEYRKNHPIADYVSYLPTDSPYNAKYFINCVQPYYAVFVKYEFWYNYLNVLYDNTIPTIFISSNFRASQPFFKWYGFWFRNQLQKITAFFVQNNESKKLLESINIDEVYVSGDTRFDRVASLNEQHEKLPLIDDFKNNKLLLVAGSSWQPEEEILEKMMQKKWENLKLIIAPHDISDVHIQHIKKRFPNNSICYSEINQNNVVNNDILIINNIGLLNKIYRYADIAFIGGGFGTGLHNILEAACYGVPVIFGPKTEKFPEAQLLANDGGGFLVHSYESFLKVFQELYDNKDFLKITKSISYNFVQSKKGATLMIINYLLNL